MEPETPPVKEPIKAKENVKFSANDTFSSEDSGDQVVDEEAREEHAREAKLKATPAVTKRRNATKHLVIQSPTDHFFSPCSQKLLQKKRSVEPQKEIQFD